MVKMYLAFSHVYYDIHVINRILVSTTDLRMTEEKNLNIYSKQKDRLSD